MKANIHYNKFEKAWTIHTYKGCKLATNFKINGDWFTEVKPKKKSNPRGWVVCDTSQLEFFDKNSKILKGEQLLYDKIDMKFNIDKGKDLLFLSDGVFLDN